MTLLDLARRDLWFFILLIRSQWFSSLEGCSRLVGLNLLSIRRLNMLSMLHFRLMHPLLSLLIRNGLTYNRVCFVMDMFNFCQWMGRLLSMLAFNFWMF